MADNIYYNALITCSKDNTADLDLKAVFSDETINPIVKDAANYYFAIARYDMKIPTLPVLECPVIPGQSNINLLTFAIRIRGIVSGTAVNSSFINVVYIPRNSRTDMQNYYFIYNFDHFCDMVNVCFAQCNEAVNPSGKPPKIVYNQSSNLFSIYTDASAFDLTSETNAAMLQIDFSQELYNLLRHFNYTLNADNTVTLNVVDKITNYATKDEVTYIINEQLYPSTSCIWSPVQSIVFRSDSMSMNNEIIGNPSILKNSSATVGYVKSDLEANNITDIIINLNSSMDYNSNISYVPSMYRWIDVLRIVNLNKISFSVYWKHKDGVSQYPFLMPDGSSISAKLHFKKKY